MKNYTIKYNGNSLRFKNKSYEVVADNEREAVESFFSEYLADNYFPSDDGRILDCDGDCLAEADDDTIDYDGGYFYAELTN